MADRLSTLDASFLEIEEQDAASHMHIGWAMLFDPLPEGGTPHVSRLRRHLEPRLAQMPRFLARLSKPHTGGFGPPSWVPDDRFDIADHVRVAALPAPGGEPELLDWLADFWSHPLDRTLPLWELVLLEGLDRGRWALVTKTHHCLVDGVSGVDVTNLILDSDPGTEHDGHGHAGDNQAPARRSLVARASGEALSLPGELLSRTRAVADLLVHEELTGAPSSSLNVPIGHTRRYAVARADLDELKAVKRALGGTLNDAILATATGALRAFLQQRGEPLPPRGLRAMVPVSVRDTGEAGALGNRVSSIFVDLPVATADPVERYAQVVAAAEAMKAGSQALGSETVVQASGVMLPALHSLGVRTLLSPRLFNLTITNVPGPTKTLYAFGAPMREVLPLVPVFAGHAIGIAVVSYAGRVAFGLNADAGAVRDLDVLARAHGEAIAELRSAAKARARRPATEEPATGSQQMANADAAWLHMDRPTNLMIITAVMWFGEPLDAERLRAVVRERLIGPYERFRQRVAEPRFPLGVPRWEPDPDFDLDQHLRHVALPAPGGDAELQALVSDLMSTPLDHARPLWCLYVVDGYRGGSALVVRMHHCIADGIALARVTLSLADEEADPGITRVTALERPRRGAVGALARRARAGAAAATQATGALVHEGLEVLQHPRGELGHLTGEAARDARALRRILLMGADADTVFKGEMHVGRRASWSQELDLEEIKAIGRAGGSTVNDVLVTALTGSLRDYLRRRGSLVDAVRALVPFNLRPLDRPLPSTLGNDFGLVYLTLPVGIARTRERLKAVRAEMQAIKASAEGPVAYGILNLLGLTPVQLEKLAVDIFAAKGSMVVTNVPGPQHQLYLAGTPLRGVLVWAPMSGSIAMSVSILSYDGRVTVGVMSDAGLVPDPERIVRGFERELRRLQRVLLADGRPPAPPSGDAAIRPPHD